MTFQSDGCFVKGQHASPATEFKPGQHWRPPKSYWDKAWLENEYLTLRKSASEIAREWNVTSHAIYFWLDKHQIPVRSTSEARAIKSWGSSGDLNGMSGKVGVLNPNWRGGCTPERQQFYASREWAEACLLVWRRDNACCVHCGTSFESRELHIHHIVSFSVVELRAEMSNLVLLCCECHRWVHSRENVENLFVKEVQE